MTFTAISSVTAKGVTLNFGYNTDVPIVGEFDGDGEAEFAVYGKDPADGKYDFHVLFFTVSAAAASPANVLTFDNYGCRVRQRQVDPGRGRLRRQRPRRLRGVHPSASGSSFTYVDPVTKASLTRTVGTSTDSPKAVTYTATAGPTWSSTAPTRPRPATIAIGRDLVLGVQHRQDDRLSTITAPATATRPRPRSTADYQGTGKADFGLFTPDGKGGMEYVYQTSQVGQVTLDFASRPTCRSLPPPRRSSRKSGSREGWPSPRIPRDLTV